MMVRPAVIVDAPSQRAACSSRPAPTGRSKAIIGALASYLSEPLCAKSSMLLPPTPRSFFDSGPIAAWAWAGCRWCSTGGACARRAPSAAGRGSPGSTRRCDPPDPTPSRALKAQYRHQQDHDHYHHHLVMGMIITKPRYSFCVIPATLSSPNRSEHMASRAHMRCDDG
jgi:hypothetical protein